MGLFDVNFSVGPLSITTASFSLLLFLIYVIKNSSIIIKVVNDIYKPIIVFFVAFLLIIPLQSLSFSEQLNNWRLDVFKAALLPLAICCETKKNVEVGRYLMWGLITAITITTIYGVILFFLPAGFNPYFLLIGQIGNLDIDYLSKYMDDAGRAMSRIFSTWSHPVPYNLYIGLSLVFVWFLYEKLKRPLLLLLAGLLAFAILTSGARTSLVAISVVFLLYILNDIGLKKKIIYIIFIYFSFVFLIKSFPEVYDIILSIISPDKADTQGSSIDMRINQFIGSIEATDNFVVGNGYGWTTSYITKYGAHPKAITFESLIYYIFCNSGICGFVIWTVLPISLVKYLNKSKLSKLSITSMKYQILYFYLYTIITGLYSGIVIFLALYFTSYAIYKYYDDKENKELSAPMQK